MKVHSVRLNRLRTVWAGFVALVIVATLGSSPAFGQSNPSKSTVCRVDAVDYKGWHAQQLSNQWLQLIVVPQNGGRLMEWRGRHQLPDHEVETIALDSALVGE
jgi:hypothetical protein